MRLDCGGRGVRDGSMQGGREKEKLGQRERERPETQIWSL